MYLFKVAVSKLFKKFLSLLLNNNHNTCGLAHQDYGFDTFEGFRKLGFIVIIYIYTPKMQVICNT